MTKILFIGLGKMGWPMAACLAQKGYALRVQDADPATVARFENSFPTAKEGAAMALSAVEVVVTMLPTSAIVSKVLFDGAAPLAADLAPGTVVVDMSSGVPSTTVTIHDQLAGSGILMVDAPVSGGVARAEKGTLAIMAGGAEEIVARVTPILSAMGNSVVHTGKIGSGHAMKSLNNLASAGGFLIGVEAMLIGAKFGLDPAKIVDVLNISSGRSNSSETKFKQHVLSRGFGSGFSMDLMSKDLGIALSIAEETGTAAPFAQLCRSMWQAATHSLGNGLDHTEIARFTELLGGGEGYLVAHDQDEKAGE